MDEFKLMGTTEPSVKQEKPTAPKKAVAPVPPPSDMRALADSMKKKLTSVNISLDRSEFPHVEFSSGDFGDCGLSFSDTKQTEIKVRCYVEKGFESKARLRNHAQNARNALKGKCTINGHVIETRYKKEYTHSGAGKRCSTLFLSVSVRKI